MKWSVVISDEIPDEFKKIEYDRHRQIFAVKLLDWLEEQKYPLLIESFDEGVNNWYYDPNGIIYSWELSTKNVHVSVFHNTFNMVRTESLSYKELGLSAIDELKHRIKRKFKRDR